MSFVGLYLIVRLQIYSNIDRKKYPNEYIYMVTRITKSNYLHIHFCFFVQLAKAGTSLQLVHFVLQRHLTIVLSSH